MANVMNNYFRYTGKLFLGCALFVLFELHEKPRMKN